MIKKSAFLECDPAHAFRLFTECASDWWPKALRHTDDPRSEILMLASGRFWECATDGHEVHVPILASACRPPVPAGSYGPNKETPRSCPSDMTEVLDAGQR